MCVENELSIYTKCMTLMSIDSSANERAKKRLSDIQNKKRREK